MVRKIIAAAVIALVGAASVVPASADPRGRARGWRGRRGRGWGYQHQWAPSPYNPLPGFFGGILGGWLGSQVGKDRDERDYDDERR